LDADNTGDGPKFGCVHCGSDEVRGSLDAYPVFRAEGETLVYLRMKSTENGVSELNCRNCGQPIPIDDPTDIHIV
jgi:transcription elongation factor Elf1